MKCAYHPDSDAVAACGDCRKFICVECKALVGRQIHCNACVERMSPSEREEAAAPMPVDAAQRSSTDFFDKVEERFTDFSDRVGVRFRVMNRDRICDRLGALGADARLAGRGRAEEQITNGIQCGSLGLIDIREGPIRWVNVRKVRQYGDPQGSHFTDYGVPDPRLELYSRRPAIKSVRTKEFPLVGRVIDLHWKGEDFGLGIISRLNSDFQLKRPIMSSQDVKIYACGHHSDYHSCWIISTETFDSPSRELWNCYQSIAQHLLAEWPPHAP